MENASKALIMAGSVLISVLLITGLVFMFSSISNLQSTEDDSEEVKKLAEFNKKIERYNESVLYGSEILSLCNLIEDYNKESLIADGYDEIIFNIDLTNINNRTIMSNSAYTYEGLLEVYNGTDGLAQTVENEANKSIVICRNGTRDITKTAKEISGMRDSDIKDILKRNGASFDDSEVQKIRDQAQKYVDANQEMLTFKNSEFRRDTFEYNENNGRVRSIRYIAQ